MEVTRAKLCSLGVVCILFVMAAAVRDGRAAVACLAASLAPLTLIWFDGEIGSYTGPARGHDIDMESPAWAIAALGWIALIGVPLGIIYTWSR